MTTTSTRPLSITLIALLSFGSAFAYGLFLVFSASNQPALRLLYMGVIPCTFHVAIGVGLWRLGNVARRVAIALVACTIALLLAMPVLMSLVDTTVELSPLAVSVTLELMRMWMLSPTVWLIGLSNDVALEVSGSRIPHVLLTIGIMLELVKLWFLIKRKAAFGNRTAS